MIALVLRPQDWFSFKHSSDEESCPFVYSFDGEEYVLDSEPCGVAVSEGLKRPDWVELSSLKEVDGKSRVLLTNELGETQYTDELNRLVPAR